MAVLAVRICIRRCGPVLLPDRLARRDLRVQPVPTALKECKASRGPRVPPGPRR